MEVSLECNQRTEPVTRELSGSILMGTNIDLEKLTLRPMDRENKFRMSLRAAN